MSPKRLECLLKHMCITLKNKDIIEDLPSIIDDLEYIVRVYKLKIKNLTEEQKIEHLYEIEKNKMEFLAELIKKYMELTLNTKLSYQISEEVLLKLAVGGYDPQEDKVIISAIGSILSSNNTADSIKTILHEFRHMHFYHFLHENKIEDIIKYPPNYIIIAKDYIPIELPKTRNEKIEGKPNYFENYKNIYMEVDASNYALETVRTFLLDLYERYPNKNPRLERKITQLQNILIEESKTVEEHYKQEGRAEEKYIKELTGEKPITSTILVDGENKDLLLFADKYIKANPILKDAYGILSIIMDDYRFKSYHELVIDKYKAIKNHGNKDKISAIYDNIINTDPMVLLTKLVEEKDIEEIKKFLNNHPTFLNEYKEEIAELINNTVPGIEILSLLSKEECAIMSKKRG
ncbi:MAG: hypothetical protein IKF47_02085 [Bacilli bacterium]|nr:hypothetical protein [Bacilli bacterium]